MKTHDMNLEQIIADVIYSIPTKIYEVLSTFHGKIIAGLVFCGIFLGDRLPLLWYIAMAILLDGIWGIATSLRLKQFVLSKFLSKSGIKIAVYISFYALVALAEKGFGTGDFMLVSSVVASIFIGSEAISILAHVAIFRPDWPVIKLLKKYLVGEMSKKTGVSVEEVEEIYFKKNTNE